MEAKGGTCCDPAYLKTRFLKSMFLGGGSVTAVVGQGLNVDAIGNY